MLDYHDQYAGADDAACSGGVFVHVDETVHHCLYVVVRSGDDGSLSISSIPREENWC